MTGLYHRPGWRGAGDPDHRRAACSRGHHACRTGSRTSGSPRSGRRRLGSGRLKALYRYDVTANGRGLELLAAGTFGAPQGQWVPGHPLGYHLLEVEDNRVVVHTRQRREPDGAWEPDYCWRKGKDKSETLILQPYRSLDPPTLKA